MIFKQYLVNLYIKLQNFITKTSIKKVQLMSFSKYTFQIKKNINNLARQKLANDKLFSKFLHFY